MPVDPRFTEYPRMLFKGDQTCTVRSAEEKAQRFSEGWYAKALPGETADELGPVPGLEPAPAPEPMADDAKKGGRKKKAETPAPPE